MNSRRTRSPLPPLGFAALCVAAIACSSASPSEMSGSPSYTGGGGSSSSPGSSTSSTPTSGAAGGDDAGAGEPVSIPTSGDDASAGADDAATTDATTADASADASADADLDAMTDATADAPADADVDAGVVNGCTAADFALHDESGANGVRTITFAKAAPATQYDPNCMKIAQGQSVTWKGDLKLFPLDASGGTTPSPIKATKTGNTVTFTFAAAGTYGFDSPNEAKTMFGAIDVTP